MRIVLIGQAAFGAAVLEALLERGEQVVAAYTPPDRAPGKPEALKEAALAHGLAVYQPAAYKDEGVYREYARLEPDLAVLAFVRAIIPRRYFDAATHGAICYHPSLLPRHRGASAINWALIMGDEVTGLTVFWPDAGIDTGPILLQKEVQVGPDDTVGSLYFGRLFPLGVEAVVEAVALIRQGKAPRELQNEAEATYEPPCDDRVAGVDWGRPGQEVYNLIRGCDPQPGAYARWKGEKLRLYEARLLSGPTDEPPGEVVAVDPPVVRVAVPGGRLQIGRVRLGREGKVSAADFAARHSLGPGDRFTSAR